MKKRFGLDVSILLHDLGVSFENTAVLQNNVTFSGISLYTPAKGWENGELVVGMLSDILPIASEYPNQIFLCVRDRFADGEETEQVMSNIIVLLTNKKLAEVFNDALRILNRYAQWDMEMYLSTLKKQGFQDLMNLSEDMIGNHIDIMDATFKLQAYTRTIEIDDEITNNLLKYGYHASETVEKLLKLRRFEQYQKEQSIIVSDDHKLCKYVSLKRVFHQNGKPALYVVMHCNNRDYDESLLHIFELLLSHVEEYVKQDSMHPSTFAASHQYIRELFDGKIGTVDEAISRASYATIPFQSDYQLYLVAFDDNFNTPLDKLATDLNQELPFSYVLSYNRRIAVLNNFRKHGDSSIAVKSTLKKFFHRFPCIVGISNPISNLWELRVALEQAGCAIEFGAHIRHAEGSMIPEVDFYTFEQSVLTLLVAKSYNSSPDLFKNSFMFQALHTILEYDKTHSSNLYRTLETYLSCNQKATETCEILHMHRNTVLYHIDRIEQMLDVTLDDPEVASKLFLGIKTYETKMIEVLL